MTRPDLRVVGGTDIAEPFDDVLSPRERLESRAMIDVLRERFAILDGQAPALDGSATQRQIAVRASARWLLRIEGYDRDALEKEGVSPCG